mgnify:CR=1 FL=1
MAFHCTQRPSVLKEPDAACLSCVGDPLRSELAFQTRGSADVMRGFFFVLFCFFNGDSRIVCSLHSALPMVITGVRVPTLSVCTAAQPYSLRNGVAPPLLMRLWVTSYYLRQRVYSAKHFLGGLWGSSDLWKTSTGGCEQQPAEPSLIHLRQGNSEATSGGIQSCLHCSRHRVSGVTGRQSR